MTAATSPNGLPMYDLLAVIGAFGLGVSWAWLISHVMVWLMEKWENR